MRRTRVVGPDEEPVPEDYYSKPAMGHEPHNFTAFRQCERIYKKKPIDLSNAVDFANADDPMISKIGEFSMIDTLINEIVERSIYEIKGHEGFLVIPNAIPSRSQSILARNCFENYMNPPNVTNLDAHYSFSTSSGLYGAWKRGHLEVLNKNECTTSVLSSPDAVEGLIRKIRWVTLGYQYDWTTKSYDFEKAPATFPADLSEYSQRIARGAGFSFSPEAGIINYYQPGDSLTGHVDRSEKNMSVPLLSISLGLTAVFLIGGCSRDDNVTGVVVRSGDVSFLSGPARKYYHGVPRIIEQSMPEHLNGVPLLKDARLNINVRQVL
jgi:alkylated DNA repair protein alkB homolog 1